MSETIEISNCPVCGAFPTQFVNGGPHGTSYCKFVGGQKWLPIETAPRDGTPILVTDGEHVVAAVIDPRCAARGVDFWLDPHGFGGHGWEWDFAERHLTHWMPLPEPPEQGA